MLITSGKIDQSQLRTALDYQEDNSGYIGQSLIECGFLTYEEFLPYLSKQLKVPYLQLGYYETDQTLVDIVPEKSVRTYKVFPLFKVKDSVNLAVVDPLDPEPINFVRELTGMAVEPILCSEEDIVNAIDLHYGISSFLEADSNLDDAKDITDLYDESQIVELVLSLIHI